MGSGISFKEQMPIYDGLRNTSAIIFAVMGAWIALLYPNKLSQAFGKKPYKEKAEDIEEINRLFRPMIYSTTILMVVIAMSFIVPLAKQISYLHQYKEVFRAISFGSIAFLTLLQFWSLILTLVPGDSIKDDLDEIRAREEMLERMKPNRKKH
ncbi:hypothetical protein ABIE61_003663 [Marinobacterium sp. MBR-111]|uniref:hypothetical protein n=1 Tax=Marinobacterium sp. MBR-111 TaxID=3156463 RepID=UPI00339AA4CD